MAEEEVNIVGKNISFSSKITTNVKTVVWLLGGLWFCFSTFAGWSYYSLTKQIKTEREHFNQEKKELLQDIDKNVSKKVDQVNTSVQELNTDVKDLIKEQGNIKGDIKVLLERTSPHINTNHSTNTGPN